MDNAGQEAGKPLQGVGPVAVPAAGTGVSSVPEPTTMLMLGSGLSMIFLIGRRRKQP